MIHLAEPDLAGNERAYLNQCIDTTFVSSVGKFVTDLESVAAEKTAAEYAVATSSGTTGLQMALIACGVKKSEMVIIPSFTFIATANAVKHCGAEPWLIDVEENSWTMSPDILLEEIKNKTSFEGNVLIHKESGKRVAAVMPVYTLGTPANMDEIKEIADKYHLPVVADGAAALGARYKGRNIASLADATVISFNGNKTVTCGGGGAVISNKKEIIDLIRHLTTTARCGKEYIHDMIGYNFRMTNVQAAIGCAQFERLESFVERKKTVRRYYQEQLAGFDEIRCFPEVSWAESACWFSGVILRTEKEARALIDYLNQNGIEGRTFWRPVHLQQPYLECEKSNMRICEGIWDKIVTLPCSTGITQEELEKVVCTVKLWNERGR